MAPGNDEREAERCQQHCPSDRSATRGTGGRKCGRIVHHNDAERRHVKVPGTGLEPVRGCPQGGLSPPCLPIPPPGRRHHDRCNANDLIGRTAHPSLNEAQLAEQRRLTPPGEHQQGRTRATPPTPTTTRRERDPTLATPTRSLPPPLRSCRTTRPPTVDLSPVPTPPPSSLPQAHAGDGSNDQRQATEAENETRASQTPLPSRPSQSHAPPPQDR